MRIRRKLMTECQRAGIGSETVFLLSVKIHLKVHCMGRSAKSCLPILRIEVIMAVRHMSYEIHLPTMVGLITQKSLVVKEIRLIFAIRFQGVEQIFVCFIKNFLHIIRKWLKLTRTELDLLQINQQKV